MEIGKIVIISAPSGCGKSTIIDQIINRPQLRLSFSVSATTRLPRPGEEDGVNYYFLEPEDFQAAIARGELIEWEEVYPGRYYGTLCSEVERIRANGKNVILDIDVKGGVNVKRMYGNDALAIFIEPPSIETLRQRLTDRGTESDEAIAQRVARAEMELSYAPYYDQRIVNDHLETAVEQVSKAIDDFVNNIT